MSTTRTASPSSTQPPSRDDEMAEYEIEPPPPAVAPADLEAPMFKRALVSLMDELLAIHETRLVPVNVDVTDATTLVLGAAREARALRPQMVACFGEEKASAVDRLELLARAAAQAHARHRVSETGVDLQPLAASVAEVRAALLADVASLTARKLLPPGALGPLRGGSGFKNLGFDVLVLVAFLTDRWDTVESKSIHTMEELERAEGLANQLITGVGLRDQGQRSPTANIRQRAFTLLYETYDEVRQMVGYLRWKHGDADRITPSWHRGRKPPRAARAVADVVDASSETDAPTPNATTPSTDR